MTQELENNLIVRDSKGNAVAMWRRHPVCKKNVLYSLKEMSLGEIEKMGSDLYLNDCAESLKIKAGQI